jgi:hypothetical protein
MKLADLSIELYDGFQSHGAHARTIVMDFVTHAFSAPRYSPPCRGFATKRLIASDHAGTMWMRRTTSSMMGRGVPIIENLVNLDQIGQPRSTFFGLPLRIKVATGSPIRAVAVLD